MRQVMSCVAAIAIVAMIVGTAWAQRPEGRQRGEGDRPGARGDRRGGPRGDREGGQRGGRQGGPRGGQGGGQRFGFPPNPLFTALDADGDGEISASELKNAMAALKKLDKNKDGKLTRDEVRPNFGPGGPGGRGGFGGGRGGERGSGQGGGAQDFVSRIMQHDKNKDGKITKDELPERAQRMFDRLDANSDGAITKAELEKMAQRFGGGGGGGRGGAFGGGRGGRGGRPGGEGGNRPRRPQRPDSE